MHVMGSGLERGTNTPILQRPAAGELQGPEMVPALDPIRFHSLSL